MQLSEQAFQTPFPPLPFAASTPPALAPCCLGAAAAASIRRAK